MSITPDQRNQIRRLFYVKHFTINAIVESLCVHHDTVKRAINYQAFSRSERAKGASCWQGQDTVIREYLALYPKLTATRLYQILKDEGRAMGSLDSLRRFLINVRPSIKEAFIKRAPLVGEEGQVDWAHFGILDVGAARRKLYCFVMTLSWSRYTFATFTFDMKTETFLRCHVDAFKYFQGVPRAILYDNLKSAVIERIGDAVRFNAMMLDFSGHYFYEPKACNPYRGNEKGLVERKIRFIRDNFFAARPLSDIDSLNQELREWLDGIANVSPWPDNKGRSIQEKFLEEQPRLLQLPPHHPCMEQTKFVSAGKYSHITFDLNTYSIPADYVRRTLLVRATNDYVKIYADTKLIAEHKRSWDRGKEIIEDKHRFDLVDRKKRASFAAFRQDVLRDIPELELVIQRLAERGEPMRPALAKIAMLKQAYGLTMLKTAILKAMERGTPGPESIRLLLLEGERAAKQAPSVAPSLPHRPGVRELSVSSHPLDTYDTL